MTEEYRIENEARLYTYLRRGPSDWQPIETAPKDGTWVLVYAQSWKEAPPEVAQYDYSFGWYMPGHEEPNEVLTHWMPLPELPAPRLCPQVHPRTGQPCLLPFGHARDVRDDFSTHQGESVKWLTWSDGSDL